MSKNTKSIYLNSTLSYCSDCGDTELARIVAKENGVFMERLCPVSGPKSVKIISDYSWYLKNMPVPMKVTERKDEKKRDKGCPRDCGLCQYHTGGIYLPVFSITNACNLNCNICFTYNRTDKKYYKSVNDMNKTLEISIRSLKSEYMNI